MQIRSHEDIRDFIVRLEHRFPVDKWEVNDIHVWPYLRIKLFIHLIQYLDKDVGFVQSGLQKKVEVKNERRQDILKRLSGIIQTLVFLNKKWSAKLLFFSLDMHRVKYNGLYLNRFFDVMVEEYQLQEEVLTFEIKNISKPVYNADRVVHLPTFIHSYKDFLKIKKRLFLSSRQVSKAQMPNFSEFLEVLEQEEIETGTLNFDLKAIASWSEKVKGVSGFFLKLFKRIKPEKILFLSYYGFDDISAAIYAANKLNIKTIDFQHGPQTNVHMAYAHWTKVPREGFNIMPTEYWCWDKKSAASILDWSAKTEINALIKGQPWLTFCTKFYKKTSLESNKILYSLQLFSPSTMTDVFPETLIDAIKNLDFNWTLRLHPRNSLSSAKILDYLLKKGGKIERIVVENPKDNPLPMSLLKSRLHITNYSGCLIEAVQMRVPSIIIDSTGEAIYRNYIDGDLVVYKNKFDHDFEGFLKKHVEQVSKARKLNLHKIPNPLY